jgi:hypothetical protein
MSSYLLRRVLLHHHYGVDIRMARRSALRAQLYRAARDLGNVQAAEKGPTSYAKRVAGRKIYRTTNGMTRHLLKGFGP